MGATRAVNVAREKLKDVMDGLHIQVDAAQEFRLQCLRENIRQLDLFILTHGHTDSQTNTDSPAHALTPG